MVASEISIWEKRIRAQGKTKTKKKDGLLLGEKSNPDNEDVRRTSKQKQGNKQTVKQSSNLVKPKIDRALFGNPAGAKYKTKEPKRIRTSKAAQQYIDIWNASFFPKLREFNSAKDEEANKQTKTYQTVVHLLRKLIKGTLYNGSESAVRFPSGFQRGALRVPLERFQYLVSNLEKKAFNNDYKPTNKTYLAKTTLIQFLAGNGQFGAMPSRLLNWALIPAIPNTHTKPKDPKLTEVFRKVFLLKTDRQEATLTFAERNHLVGASNKYLDFFIHFQEPLKIYGYKDPINFFDDYYWKALNDSWPGRKIRKIPLGYLNSGALMDKVIIPYFLKIGVLKDYDFEGVIEEFWR